MSGTQPSCAGTREFWSRPTAEILTALSATRDGLSSEEARLRLVRGGNHRLIHRQASAWMILLQQFKSPITLLLMFAAVLSIFLRDAADAAIILVIVIAGGLLGFWQEYGAANATSKLLKLVAVTARVRRDGAFRSIPLDQVVDGDVIELSAGSSIPADCLLLEAKDLYVNEAALTGETFPVEKAPGVVSHDAPLSRRANVVFMGTHVVSGTAVALAVCTGRQTEFGRISEHLRTKPPETDFERGIRRFGNLLLEVTLLMLVAIFAINVYMQKPVLESLLFGLALAVGLTPQLLPAIISVNLAQGSRRMAEHNVIVKRLASIENLGSMTVLCSDKTGTLTEGTIRIDSALDAMGAPSERTLRLAYINSSFETGYANPIDEAIRAHDPFDLRGVAKLDEVPYDFIRKRLSVLIREGELDCIVTKGAVANILAVCSKAETADGRSVDLSDVRSELDERIAEWSGRALRVLAVAWKPVAQGGALRKEDETDLTLVGFLLLHDPLKADIHDTLDGLSRLGVRLACITGDNKLVAAAIGKQIGWSEPVIVTGPELNAMSDEALARRAGRINIFAEVEPNQKARIIHALRRSGGVVGYMGDGINDAPALHAADVGISVNTAVDVAKDVADIVLLERGLDVLIDGVRSGRRTFVNTMKYIHMATSANFGNMFSMAGASLFLPFLPLLPKQVLLTNLLTDLPEMAIATDSVDAELLEHPRHWDIGFVRRFMLVFGVLSSAFDFLTFGVLQFVLHATPEQFRTAWFVESVVSASLVVLAIRSRRPFFDSKPGPHLLVATLLVVFATLLLPYSPLAAPLSLAPLPLRVVTSLAAIVIAYLVCAEVCKRVFYGLPQNRIAPPSDGRAIPR